MKTIQIHTIGRCNYQSISVTNREELTLATMYRLHHDKIGRTLLELSASSYTKLLTQLKKLGRL